MTNKLQKNVQHFFDMMIERPEFCDDGGICYSSRSNNTTCNFMKEENNNLTQLIKSCRLSLFKQPKKEKFNIANSKESSTKETKKSLLLHLQPINILHVISTQENIVNKKATTPPASPPTNKNSNTSSSSRDQKANNEQEDQLKILSAQLKETEDMIAIERDETVKAKERFEQATKACQSMTNKSQDEIEKLKHSLLMTEESNISLKNEIDGYIKHINTLKESDNSASQYAAQLEECTKKSALLQTKNSEITTSLKETNEKSKQDIKEINELKDTILNLQSKLKSAELFRTQLNDELKNKHLSSSEQPTNRHLFSSVKLYNMVENSFAIYHATWEIINQDLIPSSWWIAFSQLQLDAKTFFNPYIVKFEDAAVKPIKPYIANTIQLFEMYALPYILSGFEFSKEAFFNHTENINNHANNFIITPLLEKNPDIHYLIPSTLLDRFLLVVFLLGFLVIMFKLVLCLLRCCFSKYCPRLCGRRKKTSSSKSKKGGSSSSSGSKSSNNNNGSIKEKDKKKENEKDKKTENEKDKKKENEKDKKKENEKDKKKENDRKRFIPAQQKNGEQRDSDNASSSLDRGNSINNFIKDLSDNNNNNGNQPNRNNNSSSRRIRE